MTKMLAAVVFVSLTLAANPAAARGFARGAPMGFAPHPGFVHPGFVHPAFVHPAFVHPGFVHPGFFPHRFVANNRVFFGFAPGVVAAPPYPYPYYPYPYYPYPYPYYPYYPYYP
jgi:hypothetical protein